MNTFVGVTNEGEPRLLTEGQVSALFDCADFNDPADVYQGIYGWNDGWHKIEFGANNRINTDEEMPFRYAQTEILVNGEVRGYIVHTDH